ncbi:MAG: hypothetical protein V1916_01945, partial [Patescibacteria group bacterium]
MKYANKNIAEDGINGEEALDPTLFAQLVEKFAVLDDRVVILHELPLCILSRPTFLRLVESSRLGYGCHIGIGRGLSIDVDGRVIPCNSFA